MDWLQSISWIGLLKCFVTGGLICVIGQILIDKTKLTPARILVIFVTTGTILGGLGIYQYLVDFAGAGATVPLTGFGYNKNIIYFPEPQTDFIFPTFVANFGLLGSIFLIFIILVFDATILNLIKIKIDLENKYILVGIFIMLFYLQIQNIGMTLGLLPITGIPLPFISYGGSSLITYLFSLGIILNINKTRDKYLN